jgi:hypothetical protein
LTTAASHALVQFVETLDWDRSIWSGDIDAIAHRLRFRETNDVRARLPCRVEATQDGRRVFIEVIGLAALRERDTKHFHNSDSPNAPIKPAALSNTESGYFANRFLTRE